MIGNDFVILRMISTTLVPVITDRQQNDVVVPETTCVLPPSSQEEFTRRINSLRESGYYGIDIYIEAVILLQNLLQNQEI
jgi:hypothetical protein